MSTGIYVWHVQADDPHIGNFDKLFQDNQGKDKKQEGGILDMLRNRFRGISAGGKGKLSGGKVAGKTGVGGAAAKTAGEKAIGGTAKKAIHWNNVENNLVKATRAGKTEAAIKAGDGAANLLKNAPLRSAAVSGVGRIPALPGLDKAGGFLTYLGGHLGKLKGLGNVGGKVLVPVGVVLGVLDAKSGFDAGFKAAENIDTTQHPVCQAVDVSQNAMYGWRDQAAANISNAKGPIDKTLAVVEAGFSFLPQVLGRAAGGVAGILKKGPSLGRVKADDELLQGSDLLQRPIPQAVNALNKDRSVARSGR